MKNKEKRTQSRSELTGRVWLALHDSGDVMRATLNNKSSNGVGLVVDKMIPERSYVYFQGNVGRIDDNLGTSASVRFCTWAKGGYRVGLELAGAQSPGRFT